MSYRTGITLARAAATLLGLVLSPQLAWSQEAEDAGDPNTGAVSFDLSIDWTTSYFFRGYLQEDQGSIVQPAAEAGFALLEGETTSLSLVMGLWNSFHSKQTGATDTDSVVGDWYEADFYGGLDLGVSDWTFGAAFFNYSSPNGAFASIDELDLLVAYDDAELWGNGFSLNPYVLYALETHDRAGIVNSDNSYLEAGVSVSRSWDVTRESALSIEVPLVVGFSLDDYYVSTSGQEDTVGYWDIGLDVGYGIPLPARFGGWTLAAGVHYLSLGDAAKEANDNDGSVVIGRIGLGLSY